MIRENDANETYGEDGLALLGSVVDLTVSMQLVGCCFWNPNTVSHLKSNNNDITDEKDICGSKRHNLQAVELSQRSQTAMQMLSNFPPPAMGDPIYRVLAKPAMRKGWIVCAAPHKSG